MEFKHSVYDVRIVQNAADAIIRFETRDTRKLYEATFFDRDFPEYTSLGGLEFATKMLTNALQGFANVAIRCSVFKGDLNVAVEYTTPLFPKPVLLTFVLNSVRRASATENVETLGRRIKELESQLTGMVALQKRLTQAETQLGTMDALQKRIAEMEDASNECVLMPGMTPIPKTVSSFIIIPESAVPSSLWISGTHFPQGHSYANFPQFKISNATQVNSVVSPSSIKNIKRLKSCQSIVICNASAAPLADIESIGSLTNLCWLNLVNINNLTNISWITNCPNLTHLVLFGCSGLADISPVRDLKNLTVLDIRGTGVKNTDFLTNSRLTITK
jgi:chaperonin cofactor prefoldin